MVYILALHKTVWQLPKTGVEKVFIRVELHSGLSSLSTCRSCSLVDVRLGFK